MRLALALTAQQPSRVLWILLGKKMLEECAASKQFRFCSGR
jgi:hypothetical protein